MKKLMVALLILLLGGGSGSVWAKSTTSGRTFGSSGFKSLQQLRTTPSRPSTTAPASRTSGGLMWTPPVFLWFPMGGSGWGSGAGVGWLLVIVVGGTVLYFVFRKRVPAAGDPESAESEELEVFYQRCQKNKEHLTSQYLEAQKWLESLDGKVPSQQWRDWNDQYTQIRLEDFDQQLAEIRQDLDHGRHVAARTKLLSFDDDAVAVFEFFQEIETEFRRLR